MRQQDDLACDGWKFPDVPLRLQEGDLGRSSSEHIDLDKVGNDFG